MGLTEQIAAKMVDGLDGREKIDLIIKLSDHLLSSLEPEDRRELVRELVPKMMEDIFTGLDPKDKADLIRSLMPRVMDLLMGPSPPSRSQP